MCEECGVSGCGEALLKFVAVSGDEFGDSVEFDAELVDVGSGFAALLPLVIDDGPIVAAITVDHSGGVVGPLRGVPEGVVADHADGEGGALAAVFFDSLPNFFASNYRCDIVDWAAAFSELFVAPRKVVADHVVAWFIAHLGRIVR